MMNDSDLYLDVARSRLISQESLNRELNTTSGILLGIGTTILGLSAVILTFSTTGIVPIMLFSSTLLVSFVVNVISSSYLLLGRKWSYGPKVGEVADRVDAYDEGQLLKQVADMYAISTDKNGKILDRKAKYLKIGVFSLVAEGLSLAFLGITSYVVA